MTEISDDVPMGSPPTADVSSDKTLHLTFHGKVLEHLGVQMYQSPVNAVAELIANAWDADATTVLITLPEKLEFGAAITIQDDGDGMSFEQCQEHYLNVGRNKRGDIQDVKTLGGRPILGRKGIGKFAGFGIAREITVDTTSKITGERTQFLLDLGELTQGKYVNVSDKPVKVTIYEPPNEFRCQSSGTCITLSVLTFKRLRSADSFRQSMARRFLLLEQQAKFAVIINDAPLPDALDAAGVQYVFPRDFEADEVPDSVIVGGDGWGTEELGNGRQIRWRFLFHKEPIEEDELRGITVYAGVKLAQSPFTFNLTQGTTGQTGIEYLTGQVRADFIDTLGEDVIATERQRVNWDHDSTADIITWGQKRLKYCLRKWSERRSEKRERELEEKINDYLWRLKRLQPQEARTVRKALQQLAKIPKLSDEQFKDTAEAILTAWEGGRLKGLVDKIAESPEMSAETLIEILLEVDVLSALNTAEGIKAKLQTIHGLKRRIEKHDNENPLRDYLAGHPWLIGPKWDTFRIERKLKGLVEDAADKSKWSQAAYAGRVDLTLSSGEHVLLLEFLKPGKPLDDDHLHRFDTYVRTLRLGVEANSVLGFRRVTGYLVADSLEANAILSDRIDEMRSRDMFAMDWRTLLNIALERWADLLDALTQREPGDPRMRDLAEAFEGSLKRLGIVEDKASSATPD